MNSQQDEASTMSWSQTNPNLTSTDAKDWFANLDFDGPISQKIRTSTNEAPWTPGDRSDVPQAINLRQNTTYLNVPNVNIHGSYRDPRNHYLMSDDGTAPESAHPGLQELSEPQMYYGDYSAVAQADPESAAVSQEFSQLLGRVGINSMGPPMPSMRRPGSADVASTYSTTTAATGATGRRRTFQCPTCQEVFENKSTYNKHQHKHKKTHTCSVAGCNKAATGFGTANDLARHTASVHGRSDVNYRCSHCANSTKLWARKDNFRAHLRKIHLKVLSSDEVEIYKVPNTQVSPHVKGFEANTGRVFSSQTQGDQPSPGQNITPSTSVEVDQAWPDSGIDGDLPDTSSHIPEELSLMDTGDSQIDDPSQAANTTQTPQVALIAQVAQAAQVSPPLQANGDSLMTGQPFFSAYTAYGTCPQESFQSVSTQANTSFGVESVQSLPVNPLSSFGSQQFSAQPLPVADNTQFRQFAPPGPYSTNQRNPPSRATSAMEDASSTFSASVTRESFTGSSQPPGRAIEAPDHDILVNCGYTPSQLLDHLETFPVELLEQALRAKADGSTTEATPEESTPSKVEFPCLICHRVCNRACELRKHMKRHERPYGCTVKGCGKSFGSKNDWKRHESGQHSSPFDAWACDYDGCVAMFDDRLAFMQHLMEAHDTRHQEDVQSRTESCRIGRQGDSRFWCGFCAQVVEIDTVDQDAGRGNCWSRRFDHIDSHLFGKDGFEGRKKQEWRFLEDETKSDRSRLCDQMSTTGSVRSTTTSNGAAFKRKGSEQTDIRPRKRADGHWAASFTRIDTS